MWGGTEETPTGLGGPWPSPARLGKSVHSRLSIWPPPGGGGAGGSDSDVNVGLCFQSSNVSSVVYTLTTYLKWELKSFILSKLRRDALGE